MTSQFQSLYSLKNINGICNYADICFEKSLLKRIELNFVWSNVCCPVADPENFGGGGFEAQNLKNSDVFTKIETNFSAEIGNSNVLIAQIQVVSKKKKKKKKKRSSPKLRLIFRPKSEIQTFFSPKFRWSPKKKKKKKKRSSPKLRLIFRPKSEIQTF